MIPDWEGAKCSRTLLGVVRGMVCSALLISNCPVDAGAAEVRGGVETTHGYSSNSFKAEGVEVVLVSVSSKRLAGRMFTGADGRYYFRELEQGEYWLLLRADTQTSYWANRIQVNSASVNIATLFLGEVALGLGGEESARKRRVRPVADANTLQQVKCVDYEVEVGSEKDRKSVCERPFEYEIEKEGTHYVYAGVRLLGGAYRGVTRTVRIPATLTATHRVLSAGPCPVRFKLLSIAEEAEGVHLATSEPFSTLAGGRVEPLEGSPTTAVYKPPLLKEEYKEDKIEYKIAKGGSAATAAITVRLLDALRPGCPASAR
jgi:hypothetical protein